MSPQRHQPGPTNPLRNPLDQRLPRVAGPCGIVLFGTVGLFAHQFAPLDSRMK